MTQQQDLAEWRAAHRELATMLGAVSRGRNHCDAMLVIAAIKRVFRITRIEVSLDASGSEDHNSRWSRSLHLDG